MRIPPRLLTSRRFRISLPPAVVGGDTAVSTSASVLAAGTQHHETEHGSLRLLRRDSLQDQNVMIGVIVGVVLLLFLIALIYFLHRYHGSIRFSRRRKSRRYGGHHHDRYGGSSKGSHTSSDIGPPPPPPPPPV